jgi:phenylacetate-CoA ligase
VAELPFAEWFSRFIGFPFIRRIWWQRPVVRRQFKALLREKLESQYWPPERQAAQQLARVKALLIHAGANVPYYRDLFQRVGFDPQAIRCLAEVQALPPLTRQVIQAEGRRLLAENLPPSEIGEAFTGGSTGLPLHFWYDPSFYVHAEAAAWVSDMVAGRRMGSRTAYLWGAPKDLSPYTGWRGLGRNWLRNEYYFDTHVLWDERLEGYHERLKKLAPAVLVGFASSITHLAEYLERSGAAVSPGYPRRSVIPSGEVLEPEMRATLERVYGVPVFNRYGSREVGLLAYECDQHAGLHLNLANTYVEAVGPQLDDRPVELLVTQLCNYAMPMIRYQIDDLAVMGTQPCGCGRTAPLLHRVAGRTAATFISGHGAIIEGYHFINRLRQLPGVLEFQLIQEDLKQLHLRLVTGPEFVPGSILRFHERVADLLGVDCQVAVEQVDRIPLPASGKAQMVISRVPHDAALGRAEQPASGR